MKKIVKNFNNLVKNTIFKVKNKTINKLKISNFNKLLITFIGLLFLYIFYLQIPLLYDKDWVKDKIQTQLLSEFKIDLNSIDDISYRILPAPHFLIINSKIIMNKPKNKKTIAKIKNLKIFLNQINFLNKKKIKITEIIINNANFSLSKNDLKVFNDSSNQKFSDKKIKINESSVFFKNNLDEIITIIKINKSNLFFDNKKIQNQFELKGNVFEIPFTFKLNTKNDLIIEKEFLFKAKTLNLDILNKHITKKDKSTAGSNSISFSNSIIDTRYKLRDKKFVFTSKNSKLNNFKINYAGDLSIDPFELNLDMILNNSKISKLFNFNSILIEFINSGLLFNENISLNTSFTSYTKNNDDFFDNAKIYFNILNGKINIDGTKLVVNDMGSLKLSDSSLFLQDNKLILNATFFFDIKDSDRLFSFLNTNKRLRKTIKDIIVNIDYDFLNNKIKFNNVKIDNNKTSDQFMNIIDGFRDNNLNNLIKSRRLLNELIEAYVG